VVLGAMRSIFLVDPDRHGPVHSSRPASSVIATYAVGPLNEIVMSAVPQKRLACAVIVRSRTTASPPEPPPFAARSVVEADAAVAGAVDGAGVETPGTAATESAPDGVVATPFPAPPPRAMTATAATTSAAAMAKP